MLTSGFKLDCENCSYNHHRFFIPVQRTRTHQHSTTTINTLSSQHFLQSVHRHLTCYLCLFFCLNTNHHLPCFLTFFIFSCKFACKFELILIPNAFHPPNLMAEPYNSCPINTAALKFVPKHWSKLSSLHPALDPKSFYLIQIKL